MNNTIIYIFAFVFCTTSFGQIVDIDAPSNQSTTIKVDTISIAPSSTHISNINKKDFLSLWYMGDPNATPFIKPSSIHDPTGVGNSGNGLIDGQKIENSFSGTYNANAPGTTNKELPAVDLGRPQEVSKVYVYWFSNQYVAKAFSIQGSLNGRNWSHITGNLTATGVVGTANNPQIIDVQGRWRYLRVFSFLGARSDYVAVNEMEVYGINNANRSSYMDMDKMDLISDSDNIKIINKTNQTLNIVLYHL